MLWILKPLNLLVKPRIKLGCIFENFAGKTAIFFAVDVEAIKYIELLGKDIDVSNADILSMTLQIDG